MKPAKMTRECINVEDAPFELLGEEGKGGVEGVSVDNEVGVTVSWVRVDTELVSDLDKDSEVVSEYV